MATEIREFQVTVPANTAQANPYVQDISFPAMVVEEIRWRVPPGNVFTLGWRLTSGGAQVIPKNAGGWLIKDGESGTWALDGLHDSGKWEVTAYNTDIFPHTVYVTFALALITRQWQPVTLFSAADLAPMPDLSQAGPPVPGRR